MTVFMLDQLSLSAQETLLPFVLTDCLLDELPDEQAYLHFWQLNHTFILGMKDTKVPDLAAGVQTIKAQHLTPIIRNSGGLGVISDEGVLNLSYIFKKTEAIQTIDDAYTICLSLIQQAFPELTIEAYEIVNSYCPGTFDLSVNGKKIAGMAQRRIKENIAVMVYLSVNGDQQLRGQIAKSFYDAAQVLPDSGFPEIDPACMTTVEAALGTEIDVRDVKKRLQVAFHAVENPQMQQELLQTVKTTPLFQKRAKNMLDRNEVLKEAAD